MSDILALQTLLYAVEALAASIALPALAWLATRTEPRNAARRHLIWAAAFAALLALPLLAAVTPSLAVFTLPAAPTLAPADLAVDLSAPASSPWPALGWPALLIAALVVWAVGALWFGLQALVAMAGLEALRRRGTVSEPPQNLATRGPRWELRYSEDCAGPMTWGVMRPVVMLPWSALRWTPARLNTVLRHELAHVRRRDGLAQAVATLACALYWPNPLVWRAARTLRREAEVAADDAVLASGLRPSDYATELLELAKEWRGQRQIFAGMAMAAPAALTERVQSILSPNAQRTGATAMDALKLTLIGGLTTAALAVVHPSLAQTGPIASAPLPPVAAVPPTIPVKPLAAPAAPTAHAPAAKPAPVPGTKQPLNMVWVPNPNGPLPPLPGAPGAVTIQGPPMTLEQRAELNRKLAEIGPTINKAIAEAHIDQTVQKALKDQDPKTREMVAKQMAELGPTIQKAIADAHISELVAKQMAEAQPRIDAAIAKAQAAAEQGRLAAEKGREAAERARQADPN
jgi:beta-lactamase regulating signal transducer with metallopeptidase domain